MIHSRFVNRLAARIGRAGLPTMLLVFLPALALIPKYFLIVHATGAAGATILQTGFGFGEYVQNLLEDGSFRSCTAPPFAQCGADPCVYATRMPGLPLLYAGLSILVGTQSVAVALAKCILTASLLATFLFILTRRARPTWMAVALAYALYLGPQALKHGASLEYEEGLLLDLQCCLGVAVVCLLRPALLQGAAGRGWMALGAVALATVMYFTKTTALLTLLVVLALVISAGQLRWQMKIGALVLVLAPFAAWTSHTASHSGAVHLSSSWNGENLFRGASSAGLALYPQVSLDRLFDSARATLTDGSVVPLDNLTAQRCFTDEWAWNDYYSERARAWLKRQPGQAALYQWHKLRSSLFELRHTPYRLAPEGPDTPYPPAVTAAMVIWMGFARVVFFVLLALLAVDLLRARIFQSAWMLAFIAAGWAPYLLVFGYQRHVVPLLVMAGFVFVALYLNEPRRLAGDAAPRS